MSVTKERAMQMFDQDLSNFMDEVRGLLVHYSIPDWEAYIFFRKPDCPGSYVMKYEAVAGDGFAKEIVALHTNIVSDSARRAAEEWKDAGGDVWEIRRNVDCVECPHCGFTFAAVHTDGYSNGYSCPNCEGCPDAAAPVDNDAESRAAHLVAEWVTTLERGVLQPPGRLTDLTNRIVAALKGDR